MWTPYNVVSIDEDLQVFQRANPVRKRFLKRTALKGFLMKTLSNISLKCKRLQTKFTDLSGLNQTSMSEALASATA
jgi:hypothetical protein